MKALSSFSGETSLTETTDRRKTLFANAPKQMSVTNRINPSSISLTVYMTEDFTERVFFHMLGLNNHPSGMIAPTTLEQTPRMGSIYLFNTDSTAYAERCFVETIDINMEKGTPIAMTVTLSAASIKTLKEEPVISINSEQGVVLPPTHVDFVLGSDSLSNITSATLSFQQIAEWRDNKTLFTLGSPDIYEDTIASVQDMLISATVVTNYVTECSQENRVTDQNIYLAKSGFQFYIENARVIHNTSLESIYKNRLDVSLSEQTGDTYIYFGE